MIKIGSPFSEIEISIEAGNNSKFDISILVNAVDLPITVEINFSEIDILAEVGGRKPIYRYIDEGKAIHR